MTLLFLRCVGNKLIKIIIYVKAYMAFTYILSALGLLLANGNEYDSQYHGDTQHKKLREEENQINFSSRFILS